MAKAYIRKDSSVVWITFSFNGNRYRRKTDFPATEANKQMVQEELPAYMRKLRTGEIKLKEDIESKTFSHYATLYLKKIKDLRETTAQTYKPKVSFWTDKIGKRNIHELTASNIQEILDDCEYGLNYRRELLQVCKRVFRRAMMDNTITVNVCEFVELARGNSKRDIFPFSKEEVAILLSNSDGVFRNMLAIALYTGIRLGELKAIKWQNVNLENRTIYIDASINNRNKLDKTKNRQSVRYVPIFDELVQYINDQKLKTGLNEFMFTTKNGSFYSNSNLYKQYWKPLLRKCKLPHRRLYETRHTFASNMIYSQAFSLNQIAKWLGHKKINTLVSVYNNYIEDENGKFDSNFDVFDTKNVTKKKESA